MAFLNLIIKTLHPFFACNSQLIICPNEYHSVAIEDISAILLESLQSTITTAALSQLG